MRAAALKQTAPVCGEGGEFRLGDVRHPFITPSPAKLQERLIDQLTVLADWKEDLGKAKARMLLREELVGVEQGEIDKLKIEFDQLARCMKALAWRPDEVTP